MARTLHASTGDSLLSATGGSGSQAAGLDRLPIPEPLAIGAVVGERYVIEEHISSGGFGAVYRAADREIRHHQVALKLLHTPAADDLARTAAMRELALIASVSHPSVVQFKDYGWHDGRLWFAMPWYLGQTLDERYAGATITRAEARPLFERLAQGLAAMHAVGVHHHDIKPENIFVADIAGFEGGLPVLLDLGIAAERGEGPKGLTVDYAAPETAAAALGQREHEIGEKADVFSLALVLRNLLDPPDYSQGDDEHSTLARLRVRASEPIKPPRSKGNRFLGADFRRWLNLDPGERPDAAELAAQLSRLTEPEERRAARVRLLKRIVPVVLLATALVALLVYELRQSETQLNQKQRQLSAQMQQSAQLRERSEQQLKMLENQSEEIGSQRRELTRAIAIARELDSQLERTEAERVKGVQKIRGLTEERNTLTTERDALTTERDGLLGEREKLTTELKSTIAVRDALTTERDALRQRREQLESDLGTARAGLEAAESERDQSLEKVKALETELAAANKKAAAATLQEERLGRRVEELEGELRELKRELREAQRQVQRGAQRKPGGEAEAPAEEPPPPAQ